MHTNTQRLLATAIVGLFACNTAISAPITVVNFGESTTYVTANQNLAAGNGSYTTSTVSPAANYTGPTFWGGITYNIGGGASTWQMADNYVSTGFDSIRGSRGSLVAGNNATYVFMFDGSQDFKINNTESSFFLKGRRDGGGNAAGVTGVRWLLRDTSNNYYVSALNETTASQFGNTYALNTGVTETSLVSLTWSNYTFASGAIGSTIADTTTFFSSTTFDAAGFRYVTQRGSSGSIDMQFADFNVVAIPEPSSLALLGLAGLSAVLFLRRRR